MCTHQYHIAIGKSGEPLDLVLLDSSDEKAIVSTLGKHFSQNEIYTFIGSTLISVNPYKMISGLYGPAKIKQHVGKKDYENPPHVYSTAERAYRSMVLNLTNECVVITGESGSGKTENSKKVMEYVTAMATKSKLVQQTSEQLLESNPLLEAFGNAKTLRNDNSSRFGKYMELLFLYGDPSGGRITVYLLEKSRVTHPQKGERNFHIFYQLLSGASSSLKGDLGLTKADDYAYLSKSGCTSIQGVNDASEFDETKKAMRVVGIPEDEQDQIWQLVAGVLHLGNTDFSHDKKTNGSIADGDLRTAAAQLGVDSARLEKSLTNRTITTRGESITKPLDPDAAANARDALAKTLYGKLFDWIVRRANETIQAKKHSTSIGVLDIFGFEILGVNGFEQLCINFTNEKLHQLFIELTLRAEQDEYRSEGIKWEKIEYYDNKPVCDLIEARGMMFDLLNEESIFPQGSDQTLFNKLTSNLGKKQEYIIPPRAAACVFQIKHYAGVVSYETIGMLEKNKDTMFNDLIELMQSSKNGVAATLFPKNDPGSTDPTAGGKPGGAQARPETTCVQYKKSMNLLMETLKAASQHYIRCIKPNDAKQAGVFQDQLVATQSRYLGLSENIKVRRAGYAFRLEYERFLAKYKAVSKSFEWQPDAREGTEQILSAAKVTDFQMGKTKVFIRSPKSVFLLEDKRKEFLEEAASYLPPTDGLLYGEFPFFVFILGMFNTRAIIKSITK